MNFQVVANSFDLTERYYYNSNKGVYFFIILSLPKLTNLIKTNFMIICPLLFSNLTISNVCNLFHPYYDGIWNSSKNSIKLFLYSLSFYTG